MPLLALSPSLSEELKRGAARRASEMAIQDILKELAKLSPEEQQALKGLFAGNSEPVESPKHAPELPRAGKVYFFKQLQRYNVQEETKKGDNLVKIATKLPPRVIAVDEKMAWRLIWKNKGAFEYLGRSSGEHWRQARGAGKSVSEAQAIEYNEMIKNPDLTIPESREKTFFQGKNVAAAARGIEIPWVDGLKQR